jgi:Flp pilus assembly protein CpaB
LEDRAKRRARLFTILGLVLALAAAGGTYLFASQAQSVGPALQPEEKVPVVVAVRDLSNRQIIEASDVTVAQYPVAVAPPTAARDPKDVVGRILTSPVARNEPITAVRYTVPQGQAAFTVLPPGEVLTPTSPNYRALSISVSDQNAVGGNLVPGDIVDIISTVSIDPCQKFNPPPPSPCDQRYVVDFQSKTIYENVPILDRKGQVYTIRVSDLSDVQKFYYLQSAGSQLAMVLRAAKDERVVATSGTSFPTVYKDFGYKSIPRTER